MRDLKKIFLTAGAVAAVGATAGLGTFAGFTDSQTISDNDFTSGSVSVQLNGSDTAGDFINLYDMVPGDSVKGTLTIANDGTNRATYSLSGALSDTDAALADRLTITLDGDTDGGDSSVRSLSSFDADSGLAAISLPPGASEDYEVTVHFPEGTDAQDKALESLAAKLAFTVDAVQRAGEERGNDETAADAPDA